MSNHENDRLKAAALKAGFDFLISPKKDDSFRRSAVKFAIFLLQESVFETVRDTPGMSTSDIDRALKIDELISGHEKWTAHAILNSLKEENRIKSEKIGRERQWFVVE